jgi:hypothetical protein
MSSAFCSLEDAFAGPVLPQKKRKTRGSGRDAPAGIEGFAPTQMGSVGEAAAAKPVDPDRQVQPAPPGEVLTGPGGSGFGRVDAGGADDFFPLPGATAAAEEWQKAFTLEPSQLPSLGSGSGSVSVAGKSTLWREIPAPPAPATPIAAFPSDIGHRLDVLTKQLEALTTPTPLQSTAELFLFVAIGLLLLLAIDTLLRFATTMAQKATVGGVHRGGRWSRVR